MGQITWRVIERRWAAVREAAASGDPEAMERAVSRFEGIVDTFRAILLTPR